MKRRSVIGLCSHLLSGLALLAFCSSTYRVADPRTHDPASAGRVESAQGEQQVDIRPGTRLAAFAGEHQKESAMLPEADGEDSQPFPIWFRVFLRKSLPQLPTSGAPQYPRQAEDVARWLLTHQDFRDEELQQRVEELRRAVPGVIEENQRRARYPKNWEVDVPEGTKLDEVRKQLTREFHLLPVADLEDESPLPIWFRVYLRKTIPDLPTSGPYQYPRTSSRILQRLLDNPNTVELPK